MFLGVMKSDVYMYVFFKQEVFKREQKFGGILLNVVFVMFDFILIVNFK